MTDAGAAFEEVSPGYHGNLYVEVVPRTFSVIVTSGTKLNQLRFLRGSPQADDENLRSLAKKGQLVYYKNGGASIAPVFSEGSARLSIDLCGEEGEVVAYRAKKDQPPIDLAKVGTYDATEYWVPTWGRSGQSTIIIEPGQFYCSPPKSGSAYLPNWRLKWRPMTPPSENLLYIMRGFLTRVWVWRIRRN